MLPANAILATPNSRTLHLSMLGIRDTSVLPTPPRGRQAIRTEVCRYDHGKIRAAILRELERDGQVFFYAAGSRALRAGGDWARNADAPTGRTVSTPPR